MMNLKKILALLMIFATLLSQVAVVAADESAEIISPANGAVIEYSEDETLLSVSASEGAVLQVYFDGKRLRDEVATAEETKINLGVLQLGVHKAEIIAISGITSNKVESTFKVVYAVTNEEFSDNFTAGNSKVLAPYSSKPPLGKDENGDDIPAVYGAYDGVDGDENGSIGFRYMKTATNVTLDDGAELCYVMEPLPYDLSYKFSLEYDLYLLKASAWEIRSGVRGSGGNRYSELAGSKFLGDDGFVSGTDYQYPVGEWMHIKHDVDVSSGTTSLYIDGELVKDNITVGTVNLTGLVVFKFQYYATKPEGPQGFNIDNVRITSQSLYGGISPSGYILEDGSEKAFPDDRIIKEETSKIIFKNDIQGFTPWDKKTKFSFLVNGVEFPVSSIKETAGNTFTAELSSPLPEKAHIEIYSEYNSVPIKTFFDTNAIKFGIYDVSFRKGSSYVYSANQLEGGDNLVCFLSVKTDLIEDKTVMAVFGIYSGNRLVSLQTKSGVKINGNTTLVRQKTIPITIPENIDDISIEVFLIDSLSTRKPLSYPFTLCK